MIQQAAVSAKIYSALSQKKKNKIGLVNAAAVASWFDWQGPLAASQCILIGPEGDFTPDEIDNSPKIAVQ